MNAYDYYTEAKALAEELKLAGLVHYHVDILGSMEEGETGTEIFMIRRSRLANMLVTKNMPANLLERVTGLHGKLNDALKRRG